MYDGQGTETEAQVIPRVIEVQRVVAQWFDVTVEDLKSECRKRQFAWPRQVAQYVCREMTRQSYPEIARKFGDRDHTSILFAVRKVAQIITHDADLAAQVAHFKKAINADATARWRVEQQLRATVPEVPEVPLRGEARPHSDRLWTPAQIAFLQEKRAAGVPYSEISKLTGRSIPSLENKAGRLGIRNHRPEAVS
jgi:hypothetical protein